MARICSLALDAGNLDGQAIDSRTSVCARRFCSRRNRRDDEFRRECSECSDAHARADLSLRKIAAPPTYKKSAYTASFSRHFK
jgi:hypothetical protein